MNPFVADLLHAGKVLGASRGVGVPALEELEVWRKRGRP